jgi:uncharacterized protein involved in response to NO
MTPIRIEPEVSSALGRLPILGLGFRPFFLLAGVAAVALISAWLLLWHTAVGPEAYYGRPGWHSHEMLFGYLVAVIAGFLLTAVRNWTGVETPSGVTLGLIALVWLAGRVMPWIEAVPRELITIFDLAFLPLLAVSLVRPLRAGRNQVNYVFLLILAAMTAANVLVHAEAVGVAFTASTGITLMLDLVLMMLLIISGRIMPFFTQAAVPGAASRRWRAVEVLSIVLMATLILVHLAAPASEVAGVIALALAGVQLLRLAGWHDRRVWRIPILWVLYTGYAWVVTGFVLLGLNALGLFPRSAALHALTVGALGVFTLGMMARVALGHTGRPMRSASAINGAFVLLNLAAAVRVFGPTLSPANYLSWIMLSGILWVVAFVIFLAVYVPILSRSRVDGRPG